MVGIMLLAVVPVEGDGLVADDPGGAIGRRRVEPTGVEIRLGARHEEGAGLVQDVEPLKIEIPTVHHVNGTGFGDQQVENIDVVQLPVGDVNEARDRTAQIEQRVHLHGGLGGTESSNPFPSSAESDHRPKPGLGARRWKGRPATTGRCCAEQGAPAVYGCCCGRRSSPPSVTGAVEQTVDSALSDRDNREIGESRRI
jgi:hypothetical protein